MNLLKVIKSNQFALWVAILSVIVQSFHSYTAFYNTSSLSGTGWGIAQAVLFAVVIDLAILFYTVRQRKDIALYAAFVMVIINSYYYYQHLGLSFQFVFGCFLSLIIPTSVYFYSEEIKEDDIDGNLLKIKDLQSIIANGRRDNERLSVAVDKIRLENSELNSHLSRRLDEVKALEEQRDSANAQLKQLRYEMHIATQHPEDKSLLNIKSERITSGTIPGK